MPKMQLADDSLSSDFPEGALGFNFEFQGTPAAERLRHFMAPAATATTATTTTTTTTAATAATTATATSTAWKSFGQRCARGRGKSDENPRHEIIDTRRWLGSGRMNREEEKEHMKKTYHELTRSGEFTRWEILAQPRLRSEPRNKHVFTTNPAATRRSPSDRDSFLAVPKSKTKFVDHDEAIRVLRTLRE